MDSDLVNVIIVCLMVFRCIRLIYTRAEEVGDLRVVWFWVDDVGSMTLGLRSRL